MQLLEIVKQLENQTAQQRYAIICQILTNTQITYQTQTYPTGRNIWVNTPKIPIIGIGSHFDIVRNTGGANDNASAIAVCLALCQKIQTHTFQNFGLQIFFFDEEEVGLKGSKAYVCQFGIVNMLGFLNLEMVGQGDKLALWSLDGVSKGTLLESIEKTAFLKQIPTYRFDRIITNTADHISFREAGLRDAFSLTCISEEDLEVSYHYYKAQELDVSWETLNEILRQAPLFRHYHQPSDLSKYLSEHTLQQTLSIIWDSLLYLDHHLLASEKIF